VEICHSGTLGALLFRDTILVNDTLNGLRGFRDSKKGWS
jgi:hypothetical protein